MLEDALRVFKRYNLAIMLDRLESPSSRIQILPSVMLAMPEQAIARAYEQTRERLLQYEKTAKNDTEGDADDD